jgi:hypothetical protein
MPIEPLNLQGRGLYVSRHIQRDPSSCCSPLFAGGLGMVGFLARRKKQKALAAA